METAVAIATAKNVATTRPATNRDTSSTVWFGVTAEPRFPITDTATRPTMSGLRASRAVSTVTTGPPTIMPTAYAVTSRPAAATEIGRSGHLRQDPGDHELTGRHAEDHQHEREDRERHSELLLMSWGEGSRKERCRPRRCRPRQGQVPTWR
jgi:hypothetical protein